jgi:hypothetical protein
MKKTLTIVSLLAGAAIAAHAQGEIQWQSAASGWQIFVYGYNPAQPSAAVVVGQGSYGTPSGGTTFAGAALGGVATGSGTGTAAEYNGLNYTMGLYVGSSTAAVATALSSGAPVQTVNFIDSGGVGNGGWWVLGQGATQNGPGSAIYSPAVGSYGSTVYVSLAAWYSGGGAATLAQAVSAGVPEGNDGISAGIQLQGSSLGTPPTLSSSGLESFDLTVPPGAIPEPSTIALGVMGASALLFRRRK